MLKIFTKRNKQKRLESEINEVLNVLSQVKPLTNEDNRTGLEKEIDSVLISMKDKGPDSEEYSTMASNLEKLYKARANDKTPTKEYSEMIENLEKLYKAKGQNQSQIPWREIVVGAWAMVQIITIIRHEEVNVITSKAFGLVSRGRV